MTGKGYEEFVNILDLASGIRADATLKKPFYGDTLLNTVKSILGNGGEGRN